MDTSSALTLKNSDILEVRKDLFKDSGLWQMQERLCFRCCFGLFLRAAHLDAIVGTVVIGQVAMDDARDSAGGALGGRIVPA
jgi:hypothetical protein